METVRGLHSLILIGPWANYLIEIVAGWTVILAATGVYLWWPRGRPVGVVSLRQGDPSRRPFWRDLHAVTGLYAGAVIVFLAVTGMPWSAFWGETVLGWMKTHGLGQPEAPPAAHGWHAAGDAPVGVGWTMEGLTLQAHSAPPAAGPPPIQLSAILALAEGEGLKRPYVVSIPREAGLAYTAAREVRQVEDARTLYLDGASSRVLADIGYVRYGAGAKAVEWGIAVHQGTQYGRINQFLMLGGCIAVWILALSAALMWWKRRPPRLAPPSLGAPPAPPGGRARVAVVAIVLPLAILYPLTGLSLLAALAAERAILALARPHPRA